MTVGYLCVISCREKEQLYTFLFGRTIYWNFKEAMNEDGVVRGKVSVTFDYHFYLNCLARYYKSDLRDTNGLTG